MLLGRKTTNNQPTLVRIVLLYSMMYVLYNQFLKSVFNTARREETTGKRNRNFTFSSTPLFVISQSQVTSDILKLLNVHMLFKAYNLHANRHWCTMCIHIHRFKSTIIEYCSLNRVLVLASNVKGVMKMGIVIPREGFKADFLPFWF